jgi:S1-C subfamily serine protease
LGLPAEGVAVIDVQAGSVADKAGLLGSAATIDLDGFELPAPGDAIVAIDGEAIDSVEDITRKVTFESAAGDVLDFAIIRDGSQLEVSVRLEVSTANAFSAAG